METQSHKIKVVIKTKFTTINSRMLKVTSIGGLS
jgi:hypothetical protein